LKVVAGIIKNSKGQVLIARRKTGHRKGLWEFPGGKVNPEEDDAKALERELEEELRLKVKVCKYLGKVEFSYPDSKIILIAYECLPLNTPSKMNAHSEIKWVFPEELASFTLCEADRQLIRKIRI